MRRLGAEVCPVESGDKTLRAAIDEALRAWVADPEGIYYLLGSAVGAHPYPYLVRELQSVIGEEARQQMLDQAGALPDPRFQFTEYLEAVETRVGPQERAFALSQTLPWFGKLSLKGRIEKERAASAAARISSRSPKLRVVGVRPRSVAWGA